MTWQLNTIQHSWLDRVKLASFYLNPANRWTQGSKVKELEEAMSIYTNYKYAIFTSSGSTANNIIAAYAKDILKVKKVVVPSTTWATSINPWLREGIQPVFVDIQLSNLSLDIYKLEEALNRDKDINAVFATSLLGFMPDLGRLQDLCDRQNVHLLLDNCESLLAIPGQLHKPTCSTSTYLGHHISSTEGGFVLTDNVEVCEYALLHRAHGLVRVLPDSAQARYRNYTVNQQFDFAMVGSNYRNTEINAYTGLLDLKRANMYKQHRNAIYIYYSNQLNNHKYQTPLLMAGDCPFCLPIIMKEQDPAAINFVKEELWKNNIEYRPVVGGNLIRQTAFAKYGELKDYPNSEFLHNNGIYVGLHQQVTKQHIDKLISLL